MDAMWVAYWVDRIFPEGPVGCPNEHHVRYSSYFMESETLVGMICWNVCNIFHNRMWHREVFVTAFEEIHYAPVCPKVVPGKRGVVHLSFRPA